MATEEKGDGRTVQLRRVRLSFATLKDKEPTVENGEPKHSLNLILETDGKNFERNKALVMSAIRKACEQEFKREDFFKTIQEDDPKRICFRKGERFKNSESGEPYAGYAGNYALSCGTPGRGQRRPKLLDRYKRPVEEKDIMDVFYNGCYVDAFVSFYGTKKGGNGLFCTVDALRSHQEGDPMGGGAHIDNDDFDDLDDDDFAGAGGSVSGGDDDDDL